MIKSYQISSLENIMPKTEQNFVNINEITIIKGEKTSYQIAYIGDRVCDCKIEVESDIKDNIHIYKVDCVGVKRTVFFPKALEDDNYLSVEPGLYPDLLSEIKDNTIPLAYYYQGLWIETDKNIVPGKHEIKITISNGEDSVSHLMTVEVLKLSLPEQNLIYGLAVHADCIADYYGYQVFSEEHWAMLKKFNKLSAE